MNRPRFSSMPRWLVTGAGGRVGRMLWRQWQEDPPAARLLRQIRRVGDVEAGDAGSSLLWDPLA